MLSAETLCKFKTQLYASMVLSIYVLLCLNLCEMAIIGNLVTGLPEICFMISNKIYNMRQPCRIYC